MVDCIKQFSFALDCGSLAAITLSDCLLSRATEFFATTSQAQPTATGRSSTDRVSASGIRPRLQVHYGTSRHLAQRFCRSSGQTDKQKDTNTQCEQRLVLLPTIPCHKNGKILCQERSVRCNQNKTWSPPPLMSCGHYVSNTRSTTRGRPGPVPLIVMRAHTNSVFVCSNSDFVCSNSDFVCSNLYLFAATDTCLQQLILVCSMSPVGHRMKETRCEEIVRIVME